jgi:hypothetical protein
MSDQSSVALGDLHSDELRLIFNMLNPPSLAKLLPTCRRFNEIISSDEKTMQSIESAKSAVLLARSAALCEKLSSAAHTKKQLDRPLLDSFYAGAENFSTVQKEHAILNIMQAIELRPKSIPKATKEDATALRQIAQDFSQAQRQRIQVFALHAFSGCSSREQMQWRATIYQILDNSPILDLGSNTMGLLSCIKDHPFSEEQLKAATAACSIVQLRKEMVAARNRTE